MQRYHLTLFKRMQGDAKRTMDAAQAHACISASLLSFDAALAAERGKSVTSAIETRAAATAVQAALATRSGGEVPARRLAALLLLVVPAPQTQRIEGMRAWLGAERQVR